MLRPLPNLATPTTPAGFNFGYMVAAGQANIVNKFVPGLGGKTDPVGPSPVIIHVDQLKKVARCVLLPPPTPHPLSPPPHLHRLHLLHRCRPWHDFTLKIMGDREAVQVTGRHHHSTATTTATSSSPPPPPCAGARLGARDVGLLHRRGVARHQAPRPRRVPVRGRLDREPRAEAGVADAGQSGGAGARVLPVPLYVRRRVLERGTADGTAGDELPTTTTSTTTTIASTAAPASTTTTSCCRWESGRSTSATTWAGRRRARSRRRRSARTTARSSSAGSTTTRRRLCRGRAAAAPVRGTRLEHTVGGARPRLLLNTLLPRYRSRHVLARADAR